MDSSKRIIHTKSYEKRGNAENYIKEGKYDMAVGLLLIKSFGANEAILQMMMFAYNLLLLSKFDSLLTSEYRQQIKTFLLKHVFGCKDHQDSKVCSDEALDKISVSRCV